MIRRALSLLAIGLALVWAQPSFAQMTQLQGGGAGSGCSVSGTANQIVSNTGSSGCQASTATATTGGIVVVPGTGAASTPGLSVTGAPYTGGNATTNFPQLYVNDGTGPTTFSTAGTEIGINTPAGFTGNLLDAHINGGASVFSVNGSGYVAIPGGSVSSPSLNIGTGTGLYSNTSNELDISLNIAGAGSISGGGMWLPKTAYFAWSSGLNTQLSGPDTYLTRLSAAVIHLGAGDAATPVAQTLGVQGVATGTSNTAGANFAIAGSVSTGTGNGGSILLQTSGKVAASTTQNALISAVTIDGLQHMTFTSSNAPTCGTGCTSVNSGSTDNSFAVVSSSAVTAVTVNFAKTWASAPVACTVTTNLAVPLATSVTALSATAITITSASAITSATLYVHCG